MAGRRPGPAPQTAKREQFARVIARGVSNAEACRLVGVNPRTGKRWRQGRTILSSSGAKLHYPAVITTGKCEISPSYLSEDERVRIGDLRRAGHGVRAIAAELHRPPCTISRELRRNAEDGGQYRPFAAQRLAVERRARPGRGKLLADPVLREFVQARLDGKLSPEQTAAALPVEFPDQPHRHLAT
jgi:transposase, IS30 family